MNWHKLSEISPYSAEEFLIKFVNGGFVVASWKPTKGYFVYEDGENYFTTEGEENNVYWCKIEDPNFSQDLTKDDDNIEILAIKDLYPDDKFNISGLKSSMARAEINIWKRGYKYALKENR